MVKLRLAIGSLIALVLLTAPATVLAQPPLGKLTQLAGTDGCVSETGTGGECAVGRALAGAGSMAVSPDGKSVYVASGHSDAVAVLSREPETGKLTQLASTDGCMSDDGTGGQCAVGRVLRGASELAVSPDGKSVYVGSWWSGAVAVFARDPSDGKLTQLAGADGCISEDGTGGQCIVGRMPPYLTSVTVSPDGKSVYVASLDAVAVFARDPTDGKLTQLPGMGGCVNETGSGGCADAKGLDGAVSVTVSPDGESVYTTSYADSGGVAVFQRDLATGKLTQLADPDGCTNETGSGGCTDGRALRNAASVTVSPDGKSVYVASDISRALAVFSRDREDGGRLTQPKGTDGCVSQAGAGSCASGKGLLGPSSVTVSPEGESVYAASGDEHGAIAAFSRNPATGRLTQLAESDGCINKTGSGGCADGRGIDGPFQVTVSPDGGSVYAVSIWSDAVAVFSRAASPSPPPDTGGPTAPPDTGGPTAPPDTGGPTALLDTAGPTVRISRGTVRLTRGGLARVRVSCPASEPDDHCSGTLALRATVRARAARQGARGDTVTLGQGNFSIRRGWTAHVKVRLSRKSRRLVARRKRVTVEAAAEARDAATNSATATRSFVLEAPPA